MLPRYLGKREAATGVEAAVDRVLADGEVRTPDLGGTSTADEVAGAVVAGLSAG